MPSSDPPVPPLWRVSALDLVSHAPRAARGRAEQRAPCPTEAPALSQRVRARRLEQNVSRVKICRRACPRSPLSSKRLIDHRRWGHSMDRSQRHPTGRTWLARNCVDRIVCAVQCLVSLRSIRADEGLEIASTITRSVRLDRGHAGFGTARGVLIPSSSGAACLSSISRSCPRTSATMRSTLIAIGLASAAIAAPQPLQRRQAESAVSSAVPSASASAISSAPASASSSASAASPSASSNVTAAFISAVRARNADAFASLLEGQPALVQQIVSLAGSVRETLLGGADRGSRSPTR